MDLRPSTLEDLAAVDALLARSYPVLLREDYPPSVLVTALPLISRAQPELLVSGSYYVATEGAGILGAGGWTVDRQTPSKAHIRHLVTDYRHLRRGIAGQIVSLSMRIAKDRGIDEMECWSTYTAEPFYQAMGFETLALIDVPLAPGIAFPAKRMRRLL
jgi:GNAT superfamily N-acetyltransferase